MLFTVQPRVPAGGLLFVELPAGIVDGGTFRGIVAVEMKDELNLEISEDRLTWISKQQRLAAENAVEILCLPKLFL